MSDTAPSKLSVLFLCTGNTARSILAEYLLRRVAPGRFDVYSAGSHPKGVVNPFSLQVLSDAKIDASDARSKSWDEFKDKQFDFVITVCDNAKESCPIWPGQPVIAHWGFPDPAAVEGTDKEKAAAFRQTLININRRLELFASLPLEKLDRLRLQEAVSSIGAKPVSAE